MGIRETFERMREKREQKKEIFKKLQEQDLMQKIVEERKKSSNQRELERYMEEENQENIKEALKIMREKRKNDISFNHNPINAKNITNKVDWEVMKEKNMFKNNKNMFVGQPYVHKSNRNLFKGKNMKNRSMFKW